MENVEASVDNILTKLDKKDLPVFVEVKDEPKLKVKDAGKYSKYFTKKSIGNWIMRIVVFGIVFGLLYFFGQG